jgi:hypothetical protein
MTEKSCQMQKRKKTVSKRKGNGIQEELGLQTKIARLLKPLPAK